MKVILLIIIGFSIILNAKILRDNTTGIILDTQTKLMWQDNVVSSQMDWESAIKHCETLSLGVYNDWRLPNINELKSILDRSKYHPAIVKGFINSSSYYDWSSTTGKDSNQSAWLVNFKIGDIGYRRYGKYYDGYVRCVRGGE